MKISNITSLGIKVFSVTFVATMMQMTSLSASGDNRPLGPPIPVDPGTESSVAYGQGQESTLSGGGEVELFDMTGCSRVQGEDFLFSCPIKEDSE